MLATIQDTTALLLKQAAALLAAGHPAQAAAVYVRAGDAAMSTHQLNLAEQAYQQAANAFHRANQPDDEATADEKLAAVFEQEAAMVMPAKGGVTPATPGKTVNPATVAMPATTTPTHPASPVPVARPAPSAAHPVPSAARLPAGLYTCSEFNGFLLDYGDLRIRDDGRYQGIRNGANGPVNPYIYYPATHAITWKGDLGGNFGTILQSVYRTDNATKPYIEITFQTKYQHTMSCGREGP
ncbi:hypothetical protein GCM10008957_33730 [Deinococcus ruber]|uniref:DUF4398 domain-containing protein n=1 Tax=Deinococcus ruber TaxID=1848197 RepID=A0A918F863_9DEIO|nr:hypothetical protein GCM10008957_33730 [Deinococcus ruber]